MADSPLLTQGIAAAKAGDKITARRLLTQAVRHHPDSEAAWLWLSSVLDTPQGKAFCLERVLVLNPANQPAQRGLAALQQAPPARTLRARPPAAEPGLPDQPRRGPAVGIWVRQATEYLSSLVSAVRRQRFWRRQAFWRVVIAGLGIVTLGLVAILLYATLGGAQASQEEPLAAAVAPSPTPTAGPRGTLRPTFTPTPTDTPTPTNTPTPTDTPLPTDTPTPTPTDMPTPTPRPQRRISTPTPSPQPRPTPIPRQIDPRLADLGVRIEPVFVGQGQPYWRLIEARWTNEQESAGKHSIYVEVWNAQGSRAVGQPVVLRWASGSLVLPVEDLPPPEWGVNFAMYNTLGSYSVNVSGAPSERVVGMGLGTADAPHFTIHTCFYLTFRLAYR